MSASSDQTFLDSAMGNWFATTVGLIVGIPIAFWINGNQRHIQERSEQAAKSAQESKEHAAKEEYNRARKREILELVFEELQYNYNFIKESQMADSSSRDVKPNTQLKLELWNALSDGGELQYVKDIPLLNEIATAYYYSKIVNSLYDKIIDMKYTTPITLDNSSNIRILTNQLISFDTRALHVGIGNALTSIKKSLESL